MPMRIEPLRASMGVRTLSECAALDAKRLAAHGRLYSEESWGEDHFARDLPGKLDLSRVAFDEENRVAGFWIASRKGDEIHHTHRVATRPQAPIRGVGHSLGESVLEGARRARLRVAQLVVNEENRPALALYGRLGYSRLRGKAAEEWAVAAGYSPGRVNDDAIVVAEDYRLAILTREVEQVSSWETSPS